MILPTSDLAIAINEAVREDDEWFDEDDDIERLEHALGSIKGVLDPIAAAARLVSRVASAQAFAEGNKRTALLLGRWLLDRNGIDGEVILPPDDEKLPSLLVEAASGQDVEANLLKLFESRRRKD